MASLFGTRFAFLLVIVFSAVESSFTNLTTFLGDDSEYYSVEAFILNGTPAEPGEFPHQVSLYLTTDKQSFCGGSIISPKLILTAAHCLVHTLPSDFEVAAGLTDLSVIGKGNEQIRNASYVYIHEDYNDISKINDIAIIELSFPLDYNSHVRNITLPRKNEIFEGDVTVIGWGLTEHGTRSTMLKKAKVEIVEHKLCKKIYTNSSLPVTQKNICAGLRGKGMCHGDSGGPAICKRTVNPNNDDTVQLLCGTVSFGNTKCGKSPGVFTQVASYTDWIEQADISIKAHTAAKKLVENGVNVWNENLETPLHEAAVLMDKALAVKIIKLLIKLGTVVSAEDSGGYTFLHRLMDNEENKITPIQFYDIADYLVSKNLINLINIRDPTNGRTPLMLAAANVDLDINILTLLQNYDVDFTVVDKNGKSALFHAADGSNNQKLLAGILNLNTISLNEAIIEMNEKSTQLLVRLGADLKSKSEDLKVPLHYAAASNDTNFAIKIVKLLIDNGANTHVTDREGEIFLHKMVSSRTNLKQSGFVDIAQYLSYKRLSDLFNIPNYRGATPLMLADQNVELDMATKAFLQRVDKDFFPVGVKELRKKIIHNVSSIHANLADAIEDMDEASVKKLVRLGADVNNTNNNSETPLFLAAISNDKTFAINVIKFLIISGANAYAKDKNRQTFLHKLLDWDSQINPTQFHDIATFLCSNNFSKIFNYGDPWSVTPLHQSVQIVEIDTATLSLLKDNGVDFNAISDEKVSVLLYAISGGRSPKLISDLIALGANPKQLTSNRISMLHISAIYGNVDLLKIFLDNGLDINARDDWGRTPLHEAIQSSENPFEVVSFLIRNGANSYIGDDKDQSPRDLYTGNADIFYSVAGNKTKEVLIESVRNENIKQNNIAKAIEKMDEDSVKGLVASGANVNEKKNNKETLLHLASVSKNMTFAVNIIKLLINFGANVYARDQRSLTFLHRLVGDDTTIQPAEFYDIVIFLISKDLFRGLFYNPKHLPNPFQLAMRNVKIESAMWSLIKHNGVDFNYVDGSGKSVLYYATMGNQTTKLISDLVSLGANPKQLTSNRDTMLHAAAANGNVDLVKFFLDKKLEINARNTYNQAPLHKAVQSRSNVFKTVRILLKNGAYVGYIDNYGKSARDYFNMRREMLPYRSKISTCLALRSLC